LLGTKKYHFRTPELQDILVYLLSSIYLSFLPRPILPRTNKQKNTKNNKKKNNNSSKATTTKTQARRTFKKKYATINVLIQFWELLVSML